jgi:hypothetical protein
MKFFRALGLNWPDTGRKSPERALLSIRRVHAGFMDLCWWDETRKLWVYLSTLKDIEID